jgi:hypothetical protein
MNYNNYSYVSTDSLEAEIKEELRSYFDSGALTDVMFPTYIRSCIELFDTAALDKEHDVLTITNYKAALPDNFKKLKAAYLCQDETETTPSLPQTVGEYYKKIETSYGDTSTPDAFVFETLTVYTPVVTIKYSKPALLRVWYGSKAKCSSDCASLNCDSTGEIVINENNVVSANFASGSIYIVYYALKTDDNGYPLIPDVRRFKEYLKAYIKYKLFETLWHSVGDETSRQIESKMAFYKNDSEEKYISAQNYFKAETKQQIMDSVKRNQRRISRYNIR